MKQNLLNGKVALVTGSSRGIGRAIALAMCEAGARVIVTYKKNRKLAEEMKKRSLQDHLSVNRLDVTSRQSIRELKKLIKKNFGSIDILVNNAGINRPNDFNKISDRDWEEVIAVNLSGAFKVSQEMLPVIRNGGSIVNISSVSGQYGGPRTTHYAVSKAGLIGLTQNMAIFCAKRNIRVNAIAPGLIESTMAKAAKKLKIGEKILLRRQGEAREVSDVAVFLASEGASYITAQTINVNGGLYF
ncbi:MAG: SDR family oxidoreductase [Candidatus Omnitrophota bacterium]